MIKKICFFSTSFATHKQVRIEYLERYIPKNVQLFFLTPKKNNKYKLKRTKIIEIPGEKINFTLKLRKFCRINKIDLLVNFGTSNESFGMFFAIFGAKTKYIINEIGDIWNILKLEKSLLKRFFLFFRNIALIIPFIFAKRIIYPSSDICNQNKKIFFFIKNKMKQIPLIIDEKIFFHKDKTKTRKKLKLPLKRDIILYVGRIFYLKGSDILLDLIKKNPDKLFILIGNVIDKHYQKLKLPNLLLIPSADLKELVNYYNSADLFIFPSRIEAYGLVHREAMLCETPVLVSDIPALRLTEHALKAKPNFEGMQKEIDKFFSMSKDKRKKLGRISRKYVIKENSYKNLKNKKKELLLN